MKQLGNLAIVCARRKNTLLQIQGGSVAVFVGEGPHRAALAARWDDDEMIEIIVRELNFGRFREVA